MSRTTQTVTLLPQRIALYRAIWACIVVLSVVYAALYLYGFSQALVETPSRFADLGIPVALANGISILSEIVWLLIFWGVASFIVIKKSNSPIALLVSAAGFMIPVRVGLMQVYPVTIISPFFPLLAQTLYLGIFLFFVYWVIAMFPDGRIVPSWVRVLVVIRFIAAINYVVNVVPVVNRLFIWVDVVMFGLLIYGQYRRFLVTTSVQQRQQSKWILLGISVGLVCFFCKRLVDYYPVSTSLYVVIFFVSRIAVLTQPIAVAFAILRYRLYDVDVVLNRSLVYGVLTVFLGGVFLAMTILLQFAIGTVFGAGNYRAIALAVSVVTIGILFQPTRVRLQRFVDHRFFRLRIDLNELAIVNAQRHSELGAGTLSGQKIGEVQLEILLGKGGMGRVYRGKLGQRTVAVKILPTDLTHDPDYRQRFKREMVIFEQLYHPNIVQMLGSGESDGVPYIVMEYIEGEELGSYLKRLKMLPLLQTRLILHDIASALDYLHGQGVLHRDIKPNNIILQDMRAVLADFGLAKHLKNNDSSSTGILGTLEFVAPEQIQARPVTPAADIYALGIVAYRMLAGETPFRGGVASIVFAHINQPPLDPRELNPDIPPSTAQAILKALSKDPAQRFESAIAFANAL